MLGGLTPAVTDTCTWGRGQRGPRTNIRVRPWPMGRGKAVICSKGTWAFLCTGGSCSPSCCGVARAHQVFSSHPPGQGLL